MKTFLEGIKRRYPLKLCVVFVVLFVTKSSLAQTDSFQKFSPLLLQDIRNSKFGDRATVLISTTNKLTSDFAGQEAEKLFQSGRLSIFRMSLTLDEINSLLRSPDVIFVEKGNRVPKEELMINNLDLSVNKINLVHRNFPLTNGEGIVVSVKENKPDTTDIDFRGRYLTTNLSSSTVNSHASIMCTMIAGGANSWHLGKGAAWGSTISSSTFATLLPDANSSYQQYNISVQNHSYGVGVENYYGSDAAAYDLSATSNGSLLHIFSSGNSGNLFAPTGVYAGINGFANLTGSFKMAKNILTVGATDSFNNVAPLSSKGPAHDGRVKPELTAFGEDGSSGAAALVSGTALLLQHLYKKNNNLLPPNSLVRSILINSADDAGVAEVDYQNGFGTLNASNAMKTLKDNRFLSGTISNSASQLFGIAVPGGTRRLKATLVWNDPAALPNTAKALVNDLDLELIEVSSGQRWNPWVLNSFPNIDSLSQPAKRRRDSLNNVEQITLDNPPVGNYQLKVTGYNIPTGVQDFHIAWQLESADIFEWQFPLASDFIFPSTSNTIRWKSGFSSANGRLEFSTGNNLWQLIQDPLELGTGHYQWNVPAISGIALLRMTIGSEVFTSDTFTVANRTTTGVGFNCPDSFLFYWNRLPNITNYRVYKLGNKYLDPISVTGDTMILLGKNANSSLHYAVAPLLSGKEGVKSYTFDYTTQGVECYIRSFLALLVGSTAELSLSLGTLYDVKSIIFEKFNGTNYIALQQINNPSSLVFNFTDLSLKKGLNRYRVTLELAGGRSVYSLIETVYFFNGSEFIVYPNPTLQYQPITILADNQFEPATLVVSNMQGQKIFEMPLNDLINQLPAGKLSKGVSLFRIVRKNQKDVLIKVVVQ